MIKIFLLLYLLLEPIKAANISENDLLVAEGKVYQKVVWCAALVSSTASSFLQLCNVQLIEDQPITWEGTCSSFLFVAILYNLRYQNVRSWLWRNKSDLMFAIFSFSTAERVLSDLGVLNGIRSKSLSEILFYFGAYCACCLYKFRLIKHNA